MMALQNLKHWAPFRIDALGLVTMLGADEVDRAVGRLTRSCLTEWLPLLGSYIICSNRVTDALPGFTLYNITDAMVATDLSGWFGRWLLCQDLAYSASTVRISLLLLQRRRDRVHHRRRLCSMAIGFVCMTPLLLMAALLQDWWGLANATAMLASVLVRRALVAANLQALDDAAADPSFASSDAPVKLFLTTPSGRGVTILAPRVVVINCLLTTPKPRHRVHYDLVRAVGWLAFGTHVVTLGMACLLVQILSTGVILAATVATVHQLGDREDCIGSRLRLEQIDTDRGQDFRAAAYARLRLSAEEEESMLAWHLFPQRSNEQWWARYRGACNITSCTTKEPGHEGKTGMNDPSSGFSNWRAVLAEGYRTESK